MLDHRVVLRFLDRDFMIRLLFLMLLYSIVPLGEIFLFLYLGELVGNYLVLAVAAILGLVGVLIGMRQTQNILARLKGKIRQGLYPGREFIDLAGILIGSVFLLTPGFITDMLGFLLFLPPIRNAIGRAVTKRLDRNLKEIYEYLKLYDL
jgi:UPF0716 protein FxsA